MNLVSLLDQNEIWQTADRVVIRLTEMDPTHRRNTLALLRRRAQYNHMMYHRVEEQIMLSAPDDVYNEWWSTSSKSLMDDPAAWLERRPLVIELARLVRLDEDAAITADGEIVPDKFEIGTALHALAEWSVCRFAHEYPHGCTEDCFKEGSNSDESDRSSSV